MRARDVMTSPALVVPPEASREAVAALLVAHGIASAPVVDAVGHLVGMVSESEVLRADVEQTAAGMMTAPEPLVTPETPLARLVVDLARTTGRALPVVRDGVLVGIVGRRDVLRHVAAGDLPSEELPPAAADADPTTDGPIVVGVDGTPSSTAALRWAATRARVSSGRVRAVLCHAQPDLYGSIADARRRAEAVLDVAVDAARLPADVEVARVAREGHPVAVLAAEAREAALLVLGTRAPEVPGPGPVASRLIGHVGCPVVVVPDPPDEGMPGLLRSAS